MKTAVVIGATGVTGLAITENLLNSEDYSAVKVFVRRPLDLDHPKLKIFVVDFSQLGSGDCNWTTEISGDDLFSAMGTTRKLAGSKQAQYQVDYTYQAAFIKEAANNGISRLFLVSSPNATQGSAFFYSRMKAELDSFASQRGFQELHIFRPSIIYGDRPDNRRGERVGAVLLKTMMPIIPSFKRYKPIAGKELGAAIVNRACMKSCPGHYTYELDEIFELLS